MPDPDTHARWMKQLRQTWPEDVRAEADPLSQPWPESQSNDEVRQCLLCQFYVPLTGELGADWGVCENPGSQYDGKLVFEHWTCSYFHAVQD